MKSKLLVPLVLALGLGTAFVNVAEAKTHKHVTATFKTHDGKEIRCLVPDEDNQVLKTLKKGASVRLDGVTALTSAGAEGAQGGSPHGSMWLEPVEAGQSQ